MAKYRYQGPRVRSTETFLLKALWVHGDKYDYSRVDYTSSKEKVEILCHKHGSFMQSPEKHLSYSAGCPSCAPNKKMDSNEFIEKACAVHNNFYKYSKVLYKGSKEPVTITCPTHGDFLQKPNGHLSGQGCPACSDNYRPTTTEFIDQAKQVHGDYYDYSKVFYKNRTAHVTILCPEHGPFKQTPSCHLHGQGCRKCNIASAGKERRNKPDAFVSSAKKVHNHFYDYSLSAYVRSHDKVKIICPSHGVFEQMPYHHLRGVGCPDCWEDRKGWGFYGFYGTSHPSNLYLLLVDKSFIKIGVSKDIGSRIYNIKRQSNYNVELLCFVEGPANKIFKIEQHILRYSGLKKYNPEESFGGSTECLELSELTRVLEIIKEWEKENVGND